LNASVAAARPIKKTPWRGKDVVNPHFQTFEVGTPRNTKRSTTPILNNSFYQMKALKIKTLRNQFAFTHADEKNQWTLFLPYDNPIYKAIELLGDKRPYEYVASLLYRLGAFEVTGSASINGSTHYQIDLNRDVIHRLHEIYTLQHTFVETILPFLKEEDIVLARRKETSGYN
jgi:hypothetical protein